MPWDVNKYHQIYSKPKFAALVLVYTHFWSRKAFLYSREVEVQLLCFLVAMDTKNKTHLWEFEILNRSELLNHRFHVYATDYQRNGCEIHVTSTARHSQIKRSNYEAGFWFSFLNPKSNVVKTDATSECCALAMLVLLLLGSQEVKVRVSICKMFIPNFIKIRQIVHGNDVTVSLSLLNIMKLGAKVLPTLASTSTFVALEKRREWNVGDFESEESSIFPHSRDRKN